MAERKHLIDSALERLNSKFNFLPHRGSHELPVDVAIPIMSVYQTKTPYDSNVTLMLNGKGIHFEHSRDKEEFFLTIYPMYDENSYYQSLLTLVNEIEGKAFVTYKGKTSKHIDTYEYSFT